MQIDIPGYKIVSTLGQGGMATVYLAIQTCFDREVALKIMAPNLSADPSFGERFLREAQIVARLMHPNIVTVYDVGIHAGLHYLAMEYLPGRDLKHKRFELDLLEGLGVVKDIARALDYAGRKGYIHRDVKPENIMLHAEDGRAVLMDFGIARPADVASGMTQTGTAIGTPHYMSPEQAKGAVVDSRADLYGLGVVLFVLLTGHVPFDADSAVVVGIKHVSEPIPRLPEHLQIFQPIIDRVLAKDPDARYQIGSELVADLEAISSEQIHAVMKATDASLNLDGDDQLSPTMVSPTPLHTGEQIVLHANTVVADMPSQINALLDAAAKSETGPLRAPSKPVRARATEVFSISPEDRADHLHHTQIENPEKSYLWLKLLLLALILGGGFYLRDYLNGFWQEYAGSWISSEATNADMNVQEANNGVASDPGGKTPVSPALPDAKPASPISDPRQSSQTGVEEAQAPGGAIPGHPDEAQREIEAPGLLEQATLIREKLDTNPELAVELAVIYGAALAGSDSIEQEAARAGLLELQDFYVSRIQAELQAGNRSLAQEYGEAASKLFNEADRTPGLVAALQAVNQTGDVTILMQKAQAYLDANALALPEGANALEVYRAILRDYPEHSAAAQAGIQKIAQRYAQLAQQEEERGNISSALGMTEKGLALLPGDAQLIQHQQELRKRYQQQQQHEQDFLSRAKLQLQAGKLISPMGDNAFASYSELLALDKSNKAARAGMANIEQRLVKNIEDLIERQQIADAMTEIASARERFPQNQTLLALKLKAEQLLEDHAPRVPRVLVSSSEIQNIEAGQTETIAADREIYIGFEYRNFKDGASVVQAILFDGARSLQIAQVPVIVSGNSGTQFFRIEQPVAGFAEGGYSIDLMLDDQSLVSTRFSVKR